MEQPGSSQPALNDCPTCGKPTPVSEPICVHCGVPSYASVAAEREKVRTRNFVQALFTRESHFTFLFVGINVGVFVLMSLAGGMSFTGGNEEVLIGFGAKVNSLIDGQHQYWRLITCMFLHIGIAHLVMNSYALWIVGQQIEQIYGSARYVLLYIGSGLAGSLGSYFFNPVAISAGASGGIFGLFGVMATFAFRYRKEIPDAIRRDITRRIVPVIIINLAFGFVVRVVDNSAHLGGLLAGIALTLIVPYKRAGEQETATRWRILQIVCLAMVAISFFEAFRHYEGPRPSLANLTVDAEAPKRAEMNRIKSADERFIESVNLFRAIVEAKDENANLGPAIAAAMAGLELFDHPGPSDAVWLALHQHLVEVLTEQRALLERHARARPKDWKTAAAEEQALVARAKQYSLVD